MNEEFSFTHLNGYEVKDAKSRNDINNINEEIVNLQDNLRETDDTIDKLKKSRLSNVDKLRYELDNKYKIIKLPVNLGSWFDKLTIYESYDKKRYKAFVDESSLKNTGGSTYYVDKSNTQSPTHGTVDNPWKNLTVAFQNTQDGDTVIVKKGVYDRNDLPSSSSLNKNNINIICEEGTIFHTGNALSWSVNGTYSNVYQATRSVVDTVIDIRDKDNGNLVELTKCNSVADVHNTLGSFYTDGTTVYVNIGEVVNDNKVIVSLNLGVTPFNFNAANKNMKIYLENAICINGGRPMVRVARTENYTCEFNAKNCKFLFGGAYTQQNALSVLGANTCLIKCEASYNNNDGFNYHEQYNTSCNSIEIDCIGRYNGLNNPDSNSSNGSTIHDGSKIVRINGIYYNNKGGNVADVGTGSVSINYGCTAFDSLSSVKDWHSIDFGTQSSGATMYLYSCFAQGNAHTTYNIQSYEGTSIVNVYHSIFDNTGGSGTINIIQ